MSATPRMSRTWFAMVIALALSIVLAAPVGAAPVEEPVAVEEELQPPALDESDESEDPPAEEVPTGEDPEVAEPGDEEPAEEEPAEEVPAEEDPAGEEPGEDDSPVQEAESARAMLAVARTGAHVTTTRLNLRVGPDKSNARVVLMPKGALVMVTESQGEWVRATYEGLSGWAMSDFLVLGEESPQVPGLTPTSRLNLRGGPSLSHGIVSKMPIGAPIEVLGWNGTWTYLQYEGVQGWAMSRYLGEPEQHRPTTTNVNLRTGASYDHSVRIVVPRGATVTVRSEANGWASVEYLGFTGWMDTDFLASPVEDARGPALPALHTIARLNMRSGPSKSSPVVQIIPNSGKVETLGWRGSWRYVSYAGTRGWVLRTFVAERIPQELRAVTANVNMRKGPTLGYSQVLVVPKGGVVKVSQRAANGWWWATYEGHTGWISGSWIGDGVSKATPPPTALRSTTANLVLRTGPSTSNKKILTIPRTDQVKPLAWKGSWYLVDYQGTKGWVMKKFTSTAVPAAGEQVFVYGTLRQGETADYLVSGRYTTRSVTELPNAEMYYSSSRTSPFVVTGSTRKVVGEHLKLKAATAKQTIATLDSYERYNPSKPDSGQMYVRKKHLLRNGNQAWVYVAGPEQAAWLRSTGVLIPSGDWKRR